MDFTAILQQFLVGVAAYSLVIGIIVMQMRNAMEYFVPRIKLSHYWNDVVLPALPYVLGLLIVYVYNKFDWQGGIDWKQGIVAGACSSYFYRTLKSFINKARIQQEIDEAKALADAKALDAAPDLVARIHTDTDK